jgi:UDP-N-acetylmuramate dehydrogenase
MQSIHESVSLRAHNTFGIDVKARYFTEVHDEDEVRQLISQPVYAQNKVLILGGGSNVLFTGDFDGLVIKSSLLGLKAHHVDEHTLTLAAGSGEPWHNLVMHAVQNNWGGIENLSLIPGTAGAAPMQNIGAYGVEIKDVIEKVDAVDVKTGVKRIFSNEECHFSYRESVFKHELKEKYFISSITLRLTKDKHLLNTSYGAIQDVLNQRSIINATIKDVSDAVISIRQSKLPDPQVIGNAGSFFKNPTVDKEAYETLRRSFPSIPAYPLDSQYIKLPAGWLIEQCGWKGKRLGNVGVHSHQALVLVNYGGGNGKEIYDLALQIQRSVHEKFNITLTTEVNII